jgi:flagellar biosynthesis/type III secretory pathway protein FliH
MCNLSEGIRDKALQQGYEKGVEYGVAQGIEQGIERGIERGIEQGFEIKQLEDLKKLIKNLHFTFDQAADALELSTEARKIWRLRFDANIV